MRKLIASSVLTLLLAACGSTPSDRVDALEQGTARLQESSGFNECMRRVAAAEQDRRSCIDAKLTAAGYSDGVHCLDLHGDAVCNDAARYNAEARASDECRPSGAELTEGQCRDLLLQQ